MDREFSKDISGYKKDMWKGFSTTEVVIIISTLILGCLTTYIFVKYIGMSFDNAVYPASLIGIPVIYVFFKKENGIPLIKVILIKRELKKTSGKLGYKSSEMKILDVEKTESRRIADEERKRKKKRKRAV